MDTPKPDPFRRLRAVLSNQAVSMLLILIVIWFLLSLLSPYFFTVGNLTEITLQTAVVGIIAAGQTLVILSGGIDLSVGSVFACSGVAGGLGRGLPHEQHEGRVRGDPRRLRARGP